MLYHQKAKEEIGEILQKTSMEARDILPTAQTLAKRENNVRVESLVVGSVGALIVTAIIATGLWVSIRTPATSTLEDSAILDHSRIPEVKYDTDAYTKEWQEQVTIVEGWTGYKMAIMADSTLLYEMGPDDTLIRARPRTSWLDSITGPSREIQRAYDSSVRAQRGAREDDLLREDAFLRFDRRKYGDDVDTHPEERELEHDSFMSAYKAQQLRMSGIRIDSTRNGIKPKRRGSHE